MSRGPLLLCLDVGSSACKGALIDDAGRVVAEQREGYSRGYARDGSEVEQDPEALWSAASRCLASLVRGTHAERIAAISLSAQMSTQMLVNKEGKPLTQFLSWADRRAEKESEEMAVTFSAEDLVELLGANLRVSPSWPLPKLKWWRRHQPELLDAARYIVQPKDWILWKLCGEWRSDLSSLRGLVHQTSGQVSPALAKWAGFGSELVPPIAEPDAVAGTIHAALARELGLPTGLPIFVGWNDLAAAVLGCTELPDESVGFDITGTTEHLGVCEIGNDPLRPSALSEIVLGTNHRLRYGVTSSSGRIVQWYWEHFRAQAMNADGYAKLEGEAARVPAGSEGLVFLPCLDGERAPWFNPRTRGGFHHLKLVHNEAHFSRAVLEGIALTLRSIFQRLHVAPAPREFRTIGGGSAMATWNQIKADILQTPIVTLECPEAGCLGAAILAAKGLGWRDSWQDAGRAFIRTARTFEPDPVMKDRYDGQHARFEKIYRAMEPLFDEAARPEKS